MLMTTCSLASRSAMKSGSSVDVASSINCRAAASIWAAFRSLSIAALALSTICWKCSRS